MSSELRRLEDIAFDQYGYFSQSIGLLTSTTTTTTAATYRAPQTFTVTIPPTSAGSLFVSDLATGLSVTVTSVRNGTAGQPGFIPAGVTVVVPVQGPGPGRRQAGEPELALRRRSTNPLVPDHIRRTTRERTSAAGSSGSLRRAS